MEIDKPKGIASQLAIYVDDINSLRNRGYTWDQILTLITTADATLGIRLKTTSIGMYCTRAKQKILDGTLIVEQESLTKAKRGPKPKISALQDNTTTEPEQAIKTPDEPVSSSRPAKPADLNEDTKQKIDIIGTLPQTAPSTSDLVSRLLSGKKNKTVPETESEKPTVRNVINIDLDD